MNWVDVVVLALLFISGLLGFLRGLVREVLGVAAWVGAVVAGVMLFPEAQGPARRVFHNPDLADPVAFGAVFLVTLLVLSVVARLVGGAARRSMLGGLDRSLGLVFGLGRGAALLVAAYILGGMLVPVSRWAVDVQDARSLPLIHQGALWTAARLPEEFRPHVESPPPRRTTSAAALLRAIPVGRALGPRPVRD